VTGAGWVAGSVRARLLLEHRAGSETALLVARAGSLESAVGLLAATRVVPEVSAGSLETAQRAVAAALALRVRHLAAWLPRDAAVGLRAVASWFELVNLEDRIAYFGGAELRSPFELGMLSSIWHEAASAQGVDELRRVLAASSWGDPGTVRPEEIHLALRLAWARRVVLRVPAARHWAEGAVAILLAAELFVAERPVDHELVRRAGLGGAWPEAGSIAELRELLPPAAAWSLAGVDDADRLWRAELAWWRTVAAEAELLIRGRLDGGDVVLGAVALLAFDAMRLTVALAAAAQRGAPAAREVVDALC
jgi:hypothetical protein